MILCRKCFFHHFDGKACRIQGVANALAGEGIDQARGIAQEQHAIAITFAARTAHGQIPAHWVFEWSRVFEPMGIRRAVNHRV